MGKNVYLALVVFSFLALHAAMGLIPHDFDRVKILHSDEDIDNLINTKNVAVVYYYKRELARIRLFFKEFDKSAEFLTVYGVVAGIVDCNSETQTLKHCQAENIEHSIFTYRSGEELLVLNLETMFDVNSIMSNVLQLVLLHEVPIIQNKVDLDEIINRNKGKLDIIFSYQKAIGTYEHRIFMEVAFAYQDKYAFAVTTERDAVNNFREAEQLTSASMAAIWVLHCKDVEQNSQDCIDVKYKGKMDLSSLAKFLRSMTLPKYLFVQNEYDIMNTPYDKENLDIVFFVFDPNTEKQAIDVVHEYMYVFHGIVGIGLIDMHLPMINKDVYSHVALPGVGVRYADKEEIVFMTDEWSENSVKDFLTKNVLKNKSEFQEIVSGPGSDTEYVEMKNDEAAGGRHDLPTIEQVETEDDEVAMSVFRLRKTPMEIEHVLNLTDKTFTSTIQDSNLLMVLFYLKFDAVSMAFLRGYGEAAELLYAQSVQKGINFTHTLAKIDCFDWTDVCGKQNLSSYPTVRLYRKKGKFVENYMGPLETKSVVNTITLLQVNSPIKLTKNEEVGEFLAGRFPKNISAHTDVSVLGVFDSSHKLELVAFKKVVKEFRKIMVFGVTDTATAKSGSPVIMVSKHKDPYQKEALLLDNFSFETIYYFVNNQRLPVLPELTVMMFPELYKKEKPLVILFVDDSVSSDLKEILSTFSQSERYIHYSFCWMDINANEGVGENLLTAYSNSTDVPAISIVKQRKGEVFNYNGDEFTEKNLLKWFEEMSHNSLKPSTTLLNGEWKPSGRSYDFLAMMDYEAKHGRSPELNDDAYEGEDVEEVRSVDNNMDEMEARSELIGLGNSRLYHSHRKLEEITEKATAEHLKDEL